MSASATVHVAKTRQTMLIPTEDAYRSRRMYVLAGNTGSDHAGAGAPKHKGPRVRVFGQVGGPEARASSASIIIRPCGNN